MPNAKVPGTPSAVPASEMASAGARDNSPDPSRFCPNCSTELVDHRCKLKCPQCGYYLSCSDFY
jgi:hypothetical protein